MDADLEAWRLKMDVKQDPDLHYSEKSNPDRHFSEQKDPDRIKVMRILIHNCVRH
jgi:hypothetical protein